MFCSQTLLRDVIGVLIAIVVIVISYFKWKYLYFKNRNIPYLEPSIPYGNLKNPLRAKATLGVVVQRIYDEIKQKKMKHGGIFFLTSPIYVVTDLEYVKNILTKDFQHFNDRGVFYDEDVDPISAHLFAIGGTRWKNLRVKLTPTFTSGKMKMMFQTLLDCEENLQEKIAIMAGRNEAIDIKDVLGCYTTDVIGSCAFGLDCNSFKEENSPFRKYGKMIFTATPFRRLQFAIAGNFPKLAHLLKMRPVPKDVGEFFFKVVKDTVEYREKNNVSRKDFMQLLIDIKNNKATTEHDGNTLTIEEVAAQSFLFFLAGFETSSTTMTWALYELAKNQEIQSKARSEINTVLAKHDGKITYESIQEMKYLDKVINETLRKYPPVPVLMRKCVKDYKIPDQDIIIEEGLRVFIPVLGIHYDSQYYPDPEKFDPERFNEENIGSRHPYAHLPFGEGPRICIGLRFGVMQTKVGLTSLLREYNFTLNEKTKQPMKFAVGSFILAADGDVWLNAERV